MKRNRKAIENDFSEVKVLSDREKRIKIRNKGKIFGMFADSNNSSNKRKKIKFEKVKIVPTSEWEKNIRKGSFKGANIRKFKVIKARKRKKKKKKKKESLKTFNEIVYDVDDLGFWNGVLKVDGSEIEQPRMIYEENIEEDIEDISEEEEEEGENIENNSIVKIEPNLLNNSENLIVKKPPEISSRCYGFDKSTYLKLSEKRNQERREKLGTLSTIFSDDPDILKLQNANQSLKGSASSRKRSERRCSRLSGLVKDGIHCESPSKANGGASLLSNRQKKIKFSKSMIHAWGGFSMEEINKGEFVVEYMGEVIRATVAEIREKKYNSIGVGSSYLFKMDENWVIDATVKGNIARFLNHSCDPNCASKIVYVNNKQPRVVIYALRDIQIGEELTYDYKFPYEEEKIPCFCGSKKCRGRLN